MIAWAAAERMAAGKPDGLDLSARPRWPLDAAAAADARRRPQGSQGMIAVLGAGAFGTALAVAQAAEGRASASGAATPPRMAAAERRRETPRLPGVPLPAPPRLHRRPRRPRRRRGPPPRPPRPGRPRPSSPPTPPTCRPRPWSSAPRASTPAPSACRPRSPPPRARASALAALTGPGFAGEIARGLPTALTLACADPDLGPQRCSAGLATRRLRLYLTDDVIGAELGGALKNVIAIACGMVEGARLGASARAALMTRGFAEMTRLAVAMGARPETLAGLSGLGDLVAHLQLGPVAQLRPRPRARRRRDPRPAAPSRGLRPPAPPASLARAHGVELPIAAAVADVLDGATTLAGAMEALLARPLREE